MLKMSRILRVQKRGAVWARYSAPQNDSDNAFL